MAQEGWGSKESQIFLRETKQGSEFHSLHKHHDLTSCVFSQACSAAGGTRCWCHHWTLSDGEPSCTSGPRLCPARGLLGTQQWQTRLSATNRVWDKRLAAHRLLGGKGSTRIMWIGPVLRATAGPGREHSQYCPSFSPQPACRTHVVWTNGLHKILLAERWCHRLYLCPL